MEPRLLLVIPIMSFIILIGTMLIIRRFVRSKTIMRKSMLDHVVDCGYIYPVLFIYITVGLFSFVKWLTGLSPIIVN